MRLLDKQCLSREDLEADAYLSKPCPQLPRKNQLGSPLLPRLFLLEAGQLERHEMSTRQSIRCSENRSCEIGHSRNAALLGANQLEMLSLSLELRSSPLEFHERIPGAALGFPQVDSYSKHSSTTRPGTRMLAMLGCILADVCFCFRDLCEYLILHH